MQTVQLLREACARLPGSAETFPFDLHTLVFKVGGKMYAVASLNSEPLALSLKCDPQRAEELREQYSDILPGYHLNKRHWNTLTLGTGQPDGLADGLPDELVAELLAHSYALVVASLTRVQRQELGL
jgi:predicted DNA-binding protein (MmcQ/YjbR family)